MNQPASADGDDDGASWERRREPVFNIPLVVVLIILACTAIHLMRLYVLTEAQDIDLLIRAAFIPLRYANEYFLDLYAATSPLTYSLLHGDAAHLLINMVWLAAFGSPLANRMGALRFLLFWAVTAAGAAGLHFAVHPFDATPLVGASGSISGMTGAAARFGFRIDRSGPRPAFAGPPLPIAVALSSRLVVVFLSVWMAVNLISGFGYLSPDGLSRIAWEAHVGGFAIGFFAIGLFPGGRRPHRG